MAFFYIFDHVVDHVVEPHVYAFLVGQHLNLGRGADVETDNDGIGNRCQGNIRFGDGSGGRVDDVDIDLFVAQFGQGIGQGFD
jgi:hypothetical protein